MTYKLVQSIICAILAVGLSICVFFVSMTLAMTICYIVLAFWNAMWAGIHFSDWRDWKKYVKDCEEDTSFD